MPIPNVSQLMTGLNCKSGATAILARLNAIHMKAEMKNGRGFCRFHAKPVKKTANPAKTAYWMTGSICFPTYLHQQVQFKIFQKVSKRTISSSVK